jgi:hypothetical protein
VVEFGVINIKWDHEGVVIVDMEATGVRKRSEQTLEVEECSCIYREDKQCVISILDDGEISPKVVRDGVLEDTVMPSGIDNGL